MSSTANIQQAINALEQQRSILGDAAVNTAIAALKLQITKQQATAERKLVTVMFADISGFTALSEKLDPEHVRTLMNSCFDQLVPVIIKHNGTIDKFIGDEVMALFGAPIANEKHAELACHCALEMLQELQAFNKKNDLDLGLHIGLNTGLVVAGGIGSEGRQQYSVMGDMVNLGSRLKDKAKNGQIFTGQELHAITSHLFEFETLEPVQLKGKSEPVQIYSLIATNYSIAAKKIKISTPIIGREKELEWLQLAINTLVTKKGGSVAVIGEAGIGKSRLLKECRSNNEHINWYEGRAFSHLNKVSYRPVKEIVLNMLVQDSSNDELIRAALLKETKNFFTTSFDAIFPFLATLTGIELSEEENTLIRYLDPISLKQKLQQAFLQFVNKRSGSNPVILVWEDLHWADKETLDLIEKIANSISDHPVLNILSFRPDKQEPVWELYEKLKLQPGNYHVIELDSLAPEECEMMIGKLSGDVKDIRAAARLIFEKSAGNPFYTEELYRIIRDQENAGTMENGTDELSKLALPATLHGVVAARIDKLSFAEKWVLQTASVAGRIIDLKVIGELIKVQNISIHLDKVISQLLDFDMIRTNILDSGPEYYFKHAITQDVAYNGLLLADRRKKHIELAEVLGRLFEEDHYFITAAHFEKGEQYEKAVEYYKKAAVYAAANFAHEDELISYMNAAKLAKKLYDVSGQKKWISEQFFFYENAGDIYNKQARRDDALGSYDRALQFAGQQDGIGKARLNRKKALCFEAMHSLSTDVIAKYHEDAENLLAADNKHTDEWYQEWGELQLDKCWGYYWQSKLELLQKTLSEIEKPLQEHGSIVQKARYLNNKIILEFRTLNYQLTQHTIDLAYEALKLNKQTGDLKLMANTWFQLGFTLLWANKIEESKRIYEDHWVDISKIGDKVISTRGITYFYTACRRAGDVDKTEKLVNEYLNSGNYPPVPEYLLAAHSTLIWIHWKYKDQKRLEESITKCLPFIENRNLFTPFRFFYLAPMIAYYFETNNFEKIIPLLNDLILPNQRKLETDLQRAVEECLNGWETQSRRPDKNLIKTILDLAKQYKYL